MTKKTRQDTLDQLCQLGYDASPANGDCFDIRQGGYTHYLNGEEAKALSLASLNHPVDLRDYASRQGLNLWYSFDCGISGHTIFF